MVKNKLEPLFSKSLSNHKDRLWYQKLQVNQLAHTKTPADYLILSKERRYLVECKQTILKTGKERYTFDRLTQKGALLYFEDKHLYNHSYVLIAFYPKRDNRFYLKDAHFFMISIKQMLNMELSLGKKSATLKDFLGYIPYTRIRIYNSHIDLRELFL